MRCRFVKEIFHNKENGFCIFVYRTEDGSVPEAARDARYKGKGFQFTATGSSLPDTDRMGTCTRTSSSSRKKYTSS